VDGCGAGGGAGAQELGVRGVGSIAKGERWGGGGCGAGGGRTRRNKRGRQQQAKRCRGGRGRQQSAAREVRKSAGGTRLRAGQKQARKGCGWMWCGRGTGCAGVGSEGG